MKHDDPSFGERPGVLARFIIWLLAPLFRLWNIVWMAIPLIVLLLISSWLFGWPWEF